MNNRELCAAFARGATSGKGSNLYIRGNVLFSYSAHWPLVIRREGGNALLNSGRYSVTTSKHRSFAVSALHRAGFTLHDRTPEEMRALVDGGA